MNCYFFFRKPKFDVAIISTVSNDLGLYMAKEYFDAPIMMFFVGTNYCHGAACTVLYM